MKCLWPAINRCHHSILNDKISPITFMAFFNSEMEFSTAVRALSRPPDLEF